MDITDLETERKFVITNLTAATDTEPDSEVIHSSSRLYRKGFQFKQINLIDARASSEIHQGTERKFDGPKSGEVVSVKDEFDFFERGGHV